MKKYLLGIAMALVAVCAHAQDTSANAQTNVKSSAGANAANNGNAQSISFNDPGTEHLSGKVRYEQAGSVLLGGFAAGFSSNNCANTAQGGLGTFWANIGFGGPKESISCNRRQTGIMFDQHAVTIAQLKLEDRTVAAKVEAMATWSFCTVDAETTRQCAKLGLVKMETQHKGSRYNDPAPSSPAY